MGFEEWTRITFFLPCNDSKEAIAVNRIINRLRTKYGGATHSLPMPTTVRGYYKYALPNGRKRWVRDEIVFLVTDTNEKVGDKSVEDYLENLKKDIFSYYNSVGSPQDEIWVVTNRIWRLV